MLLQMALFHSFTWLGNIPLYICTSSSHIYHTSLYTYHSSVNGHLGCFHVLVIVNSAAVNPEVHASFQIMVWAGAALLDQMVPLFLVF